MSGVTIELNNLEVDIEYEVDTDILIPENKKITDITILHTQPEYFMDRYCEDFLEEKIKEALSE